MDLFNAAKLTGSSTGWCARTAHFCFFLSTDSLAEQNPAPPYALNLEDISNSQVTILLPEELQNPCHSVSPLLYSLSTAINADFQSSVSSNKELVCSIKESGDAGKPLALSRTSPLSLTDPFEKPQTLTLIPGRQSSRPPEMLLEQTLIQMQPFKELDEDPAASSPPVPPATVIRKDRFSNFSVRRTNSEAVVQVAGQAQSPVPAVCTDATVGDQLWSKLRPRSQRDSMSSSSSISSSDTVIDLSLPNPVLRNRFSTVSSSCDPTWDSCGHSPLTSRQSECHKDKLRARPTLPPLDNPLDSPSKQVQRRRTWSRLYMEELKQSSVSRLPSAATSDSMSKSLGDLTSEDISCPFDSTYHSISRGFVSRPSREQKPKARQQPQPPDNLTEQLRRLASVEPLTPKDFGECRARDMEEEEESTGARRPSRSHSRVRHIADRARKAQERQRIQGFIQGRSASFSFTACAGSSSRRSPIEERGNPEGACSSARSTCSSEDLLEQLNLLVSQSPRLSRLPAEPQNTDVFFLLRL